MDPTESGVLLHLGPLALTNTALTSMGIVVLVLLVLLPIRSRLRLEPGSLQTILETIVDLEARAISAVAPNHTRALLPFVGSLWIFLVLANLVGLIPGLHSPTRDLSATAALALLVFVSVHVFGIRLRGPKAYFRHYLAPSPLLLPFHLISEVTRTVALAVRLFGNMMSLEMAALLVLLVAGFLVPIPILMLHIVEALVQAYIFGMLALVYIASGLQLHDGAVADPDNGPISASSAEPSNSTDSTGSP
jgi:F-type H+-transporting ATPase subunit a